MLDCLHMPQRLPEGMCGRLLRSENGERPSARTAFSPTALLGFHLQVPRRLGTVGVEIHFFADGAGKLLSLPLAFTDESEGKECYAALLDVTPLAAYASFFTYRITLITAYGRIGVQRGRGSKVCFLQENEGTERDFFFYFSSPAYTPPTNLYGGVLYAANAISQHTGTPKIEQRGLFAHLSRLGVTALWLADAPAITGQSGIWRPDCILPHGGVKEAEKYGVALYPDFWLAAGVRSGVGYLAAPPEASSLTGTGEPMPSSCGTAPLAPAAEQNKRRPCCEHFCGENGSVKTWMRAGAGGFVLRAADGVGDAFLTSIRQTMEDEGKGVHALLGVLQRNVPTAIAFGMRRRFFFGRELEGSITPVLRSALLRYLLHGETEELEAYLLDGLSGYPPAALHATVQAISDPQNGYFAHALPQTSSRASLAQLAYLIAATLPGCPMILEGEEYGETGGEGEDAQLAFYLRVAALRRKEAVYRSGELRLLHLDEGMLVFSREREGEALLTVVNRKAEPLTVAGNFTVLFGGRGRKTSFTLSPCGGAVLRVALWSGEFETLRFFRAGETCEEESEAHAESAEFLHFATHGLL